MLIQGKNNKIFEVIIKEYAPQEYFGCVKNENYLNMGEIYFKISNSRTYLQKIQTFEEFQHFGVGQAMLDAMEYVSIIKRADCIEGKFFPSNDYARHFYEKNGYSIDKEYYETLLFKSIYRDKMLARLSEKIVMVKTEDTGLEV